MAIPGFDKRGPAAAPKKNPWLDVDVPGRRTPDLDPGRYRLAFASREMSEYNTLKLNFDGVAGGPPAQHRLFFKSPKSSAISKETILALGMALVGAESKEEFFAFDAEADILEFLVNGTDSAFVRALNLVGRHVIADITLGGESTDKDGNPTGNYRNFSVSPVPEEEQEVSLS
jgi:hypothetical protein